MSLDQSIATNYYELDLHGDEPINPNFIPSNPYSCEDYEVLSNEKVEEETPKSSSNLAVKAAGTSAGILGGYGHTIFCPVHGILPNIFYQGGGLGAGLKVFSSIESFQEKATNFIYENVFMQEGLRDSNLYLDMIHNRQVLESSLYSNTEVGVGVATSVGIGFGAYKGLKAIGPKIFKAFKNSANERSMYLENLIELKKNKKS
ncbi:MAG: hypothetical protein ACMXX7_02885 [Candidatus Woesearchaeota archaeon]